MFVLKLYKILLLESILLPLVTCNSLFSIDLPTKCPSPPCVCSGGNGNNNNNNNVNTVGLYGFARKSVHCVSDRLNQIPIEKMDPETEMLNVTAPLGSYNSITLGRFFDGLEQLNELHITRSRLPAIGDYTFCPSQNLITTCFPQGCRSKIRILNLSHNSLQSLRDKELYCLDNLRRLDLSNNHLRNLPSAAFQKLRNLTHLDLSHNLLGDFSPLMFFGLDDLIELDLSHNLFQKIDSKVLSNTPSLVKLKLNHCQIIKLDSSVFHGLSKLEYLDLSNNQLNHFNASAFEHLLSLRTLKLSSNRITVLPDKLFAGLRLQSLDLSMNSINPLKGCPFCLSAIHTLDLSSNPINSYSSITLDPLGTSLEKLILNYNRKLIDPHSSLVGLLHPLRRLRYLSVVGWRLNETIPEAVFDNHESLTYLNVSHNELHELSARLLSPLRNLIQLDVSHNELTYIDPATLEALSRMSNLQKLYFAGNPFSCYRCHILPLIEWLSNSEPPMAYWNVCDRLSQDSATLGFCAQCATPNSLRGRFLHEANLNQELEWCTNPEVQLRLTASEPQVGLILAFLIIVSLIAVILVVVAIYRKHGAVYYTQEDKYPSTEKIYHENMNMGHPQRGHSSHYISRQTTFTSPNSSLDAGLPSGAAPPPTSNQSNNGPTMVIQTPNSGGANPTSGVCNDCASSPQVKQMLASIPAMTEMLEQSLNAAVKSGAMVNKVAPPPSTFKAHQVDSTRRELSANDLAQSQHKHWTLPHKDPPSSPAEMLEQSSSPDKILQLQPNPDLSPKNVIQASSSSMGRNSPNDGLSTSDVHIYI